MIHEAYVSYEVAKLLKGKGFDEECDNYYNQSSDEPQQLTLDEMYYSYDEFVKAPTHQMACAWLREFHNIFILVGWLPIQKKYFTRIINMTDGCPKRNLHEHADYEDAVEEALKYTLENLI